MKFKRKKDKKVKIILIRIKKNCDTVADPGTKSFHVKFLGMECVLGSEFCRYGSNRDSVCVSGLKLECLREMYVWVTNDNTCRCRKRCQENSELDLPLTN